MVPDEVLSMKLDVEGDYEGSVTISSPVARLNLSLAELKARSKEGWLFDDQT